MLLALLGVLKHPLVAEETPYAQSRLACVLYLCRFYAICDTPEYHLSVDAATEASNCIQAFLDHYCCLCQWAIDNGKLMWPLTIKFHYLAHEKLDIRHRLNPKFGSTYRGESFVGKFAQVALSCSYGKPAHDISRFVLPKLQMASAVSKRKTC